MREREKEEEVRSSCELSSHTNAFRWDLADIFPTPHWDFHRNLCHVKHKHIQQHQRWLGTVTAKPLSVNLLAMNHGLDLFFITV